MNSDRCPLCLAADGCGPTDCTCGVEPGEQIATLRNVVTDRLARAWVSLGCGGLVLFLASSVLAANQYTWSTLAVSTVGLGGALVLRGLRVVSKTRRDLLLIAARAALPPARVVT